MQARALVFAICLFLFSLPAHADRKIRQMEPVQAELLSPSLELTDCPGVRVVEWRPASGFEKTTGPNNKSLGIINKTCAQARQAFIPFLKRKGIRFNHSLHDFEQKVSLIPAIPRYGGSEYRNLNDISFRFSSRVRELDENGHPYPIWGYTNSGSKYIFVRGDVLLDNEMVNARFVTVFAHEMFHAMAFYFNIPNAENENLAMEFTSYLNLGR